MASTDRSALPRVDGMHDKVSIGAAVSVGSFRPRSSMLSFGIVLIGIVVSGCRPAAAFSSPTLVCNRSSQPRNEAVLFSSTNLYYRDDALDRVGVDRSNSNEAGKPSDFTSRMKSIVVKRQRSTSPRQNSSFRPENVKIASSLEEFAGIIKEGRRDDKVVAVRFYATWCKLCHALRPSFDKAASSNPEMIFVDVPVLEANTNLHQGLGVDSVPFGHIYHPTNGLVEEMKLSRKSFSEFEDLMKVHSSQ